MIYVIKITYNEMDTYEAAAIRIVSLYLVTGAYFPIHNRTGLQIYGSASPYGVYTTENVNCPW